jgi:histidyl-tRNA synthetase
VLISTLFFVIENKNDFTSDTATSLKNMMNDNLSSISLYPSEHKKLSENENRIWKRAFLLTITRMTSIGFQLEITESCHYLESRSLSHKFLSEIENGNYENRKISKAVNLLLNYFKRKSADKKPVPPEMVNEVYLIYKLMSDVRELNNTLRSSFSIEAKPVLKNKSVGETKFLNSFVNENMLIFEELIQKFDLLQKEKLNRGWLSGNPKSRLSSEFPEFVQTQVNLLNCLYSNIIDNLGNLLSNITSAEKVIEERKAKNPKYKSKTSVSWSLLTKLLVTDNTLKSDELNENGVKTELLFSLESALDEILGADKQVKSKPKLPKGTRDYTPLQMSIKGYAIKTIKEIFSKHGGVEIDTPVFELRETLLGKYGEEGGKLVYDLEDQGGELLSLRYDLTVPFARYMGLNNIQKIKRFHIAKVYRRDQPNMKRGRFREFYQCDFDISGKYDAMIPDAEILTIMAEILLAFDLDFEIKISHRLLLEAMVECAGIPLSKFKFVCSSIDKLDKESWETVSLELKNQKGLNEDQINALSKMIVFKGPIKEIINNLRDQKIFGENKKAKKSLEELELLEKYLNLLGKADRFRLDLTMARGLDYYTGVIYEAVLKEGGLKLGSIGGGGRYDDLIGMFSKKKIPSVGMSIGIERLFILLEKKFKKKARKCQTEVLVATIGNGLIEKKLQMVRNLWEENIKAEILYNLKGKVDRQLKYSLENGIPLIIWIGEEEAKNKVYNVKNLNKKSEEKVEEDKLIEYIKDQLKKN